MPLPLCVFRPDSESWIKNNIIRVRYVFHYLRMQSCCFKCHLLFMQRGRTQLVTILLKSPQTAVHFDPCMILHVQLARHTEYGVSKE